MNHSKGARAWFEFILESGESIPIQSVCLRWAFSSDRTRTFVPLGRRVLNLDSTHTDQGPYSLVLYCPHNRCQDIIDKERTVRLAGFLTTKIPCPRIPQSLLTLNSTVQGQWPEKRTYMSRGLYFGPVVSKNRWQWILCLKLLKSQLSDLDERGLSGV